MPRLSRDPAAILLKAALAHVNGRPAQGHLPDDVDGAIAVATRQRLGLLAAVGARALGASVPQHVIDAGQRAAVASAAVFAMAAHEVSALLSAQGVAHVFFKGVVSDARWFGGRGLRGTSDIDVLVSDLAAAVEALAPVVRGTASEVRRPWLGRAHTNRTLPASILGANLHIDVHGRWLTAPLLDDTPGVLARRVRDRLPRPSDEDYAAFLAGNLVGDGFSGRLKLALDLTMLLSLPPERAPDWEVVAARARAWRCAGALWALARFTVEELGAPTEEALERLAPRNPVRRALLRASMAGAWIPGGVTRGFETDALGPGLIHVARYVPARLMDRLLRDRRSERTHAR